MIDNRIVNGGFEAIMLSPPWSGSNVTLITSNSHSGSKSARFEGGTSNASISQRVTVSPGENFEFLVSLAKIGTATSPPISIVISYRDSANNTIPNTLPTTINIPSGRLPNNNEDDWMEIYSTTSVAPNTATQALVEITKSGLSNSAPVLVDDVALLAFTGSGAQGPAGPIGPQGPAGPPGPAGSGAAPALFVGLDRLSPNPFPPSNPDDVLIMDVEVITTEANQRVKLDATIETIAKAYADPGGFPRFDISLLYFLFRGIITSPNFLRFAYVSGSHLRPDFEPPGGTFFTWNSTFTCVDIPGPPGTYVYKIIARGAGVAPFDELSPGNLGLTATVYPPA